MEAEREVILDEIAMHDDDPDDVVSNVYARKAWGASPLGRPIAGSVESIKALTRTQITRYYRTRYAPEHMVVAVAGNIDHATVVRLVRKAFSRSNFLVDTSVRPLAVRRGARARRTSTGDVVVSRPFEQANIVLGVNGLVRTDDRRYALDSGKIARDLGFVPAESFETGLRKTVAWYLANEAWWRGVMDGSYREWVRRWYGGREGERA